MIFSAWAISAVVWPPWIIAWPYIEGGRTVPENECYIQFIYRYAITNTIINVIYICKNFALNEISILFISFDQFQQ